MTENEAIKVVKTEKECVLRNIQGCDRDCGKCDLVMDDKTIIEGYDTAIKALEEVQQYRSIGTVEECREAVERNKEKRYEIVKPCKSVSYYQCPTCNALLYIDENFCEECGQAISWEENEG